MCALFSPEILQAGAVKGLRMIPGEHCTISHFGFVTHCDHLITNGPQQHCTQSYFGFVTQCNHLITNGPQQHCTQSHFRFHDPLRPSHWEWSTATLHPISFSVSWPTATISLRMVHGNTAPNLIFGFMTHCGHLIENGWQQHCRTSASLGSTVIRMSTMSSDRRFRSRLSDIANTNSTINNNEKRK